MQWYAGLCRDYAVDILLATAAAIAPGLLLEGARGIDFHIVVFGGDAYTSELDRDLGGLHIDDIRLMCLER